MTNCPALHLLLQEAPYLPLRFFAKLSIDKIFHAYRVVMGPDVSPQNDVGPGVALEIDFAWAPNPFGAEVLDPVWEFFLIRFDPT